MAVSNFLELGPPLKDQVTDFVKSRLAFNSKISHSSLSVACAGLLGMTQ
jgi:hypothetical protein